MRNKDPGNDQEDKRRIYGPCVQEPCWNNLVCEGSFWLCKGFAGGGGSDCSSGGRGEIGGHGRFPAPIWYIFGQWGSRHAPRCVGHLAYRECVLLFNACSCKTSTLDPPPRETRRLHTEPSQTPRYGPACRTCSDYAADPNDA